MSNNWNVRGVMEAAHKALNIKDLAQGIAEQAKENITDNNQIDAAFMRASTYIVVNDGTSTYGQTWPDGDYFGVKSQRDVHREKADPADLGDATALIGVAAVYTIYNEIREPFLYPALESGADILPRVVKPF